MIERERGNFVSDEPFDIFIEARVLFFIGSHERPVHDRHDPVWRTVDLAEGIQLFEVPRLESGGAVQGFCGRGGQIILGREWAAGKRPLPEERFTDPTCLYPTDRTSTRVTSSGPS